MGARKRKRRSTEGRPSQIRSRKGKSQATRYAVYIGGVVILALLGVAAFLLISPGSPSLNESGETQVTMALPSYVRASPWLVQEAYLFALERPDVLHYIPCFCGCESGGHTSNLDCFISGADSQGSVAFDNHGYG